MSTLLGVLPPPLASLHDLGCDGPGDCSCVPIYVVERTDGQRATDQTFYTAAARNERADSRIIGGPASVLIPPGRGRSRTTRE